MRLFVGIKLPEDIKQEIAMLCGGIPGAKWAAKDNFHITLAFLGEIPDLDMAELGLMLGKIDYPAFDFSIRGVGIFGSAKRPRILWAGIEDAEKMVGLQAKIVQMLSMINCPFDSRKFSPHITLARIHKAPYDRIRHFLGDHGLFSASRIHAHDFSLFSSHSTGAGPEYREEMAFDLTD